MADLLPPPIAFLLPESPDLPREILVPGGDGPGPALLPATLQAPDPLAAAAALPAPEAAIPHWPALAPLPDGIAPAVSQAPDPAAPPASAFPSLAALEAILDAIAAAPRPMPTAGERATMLALLGLDPALADDPMAFEAALRDAPVPDPDAVLDRWLSEAGAVPPEPDPFPVTPDWLLG